LPRTDKSDGGTCNDKKYFSLYLARAKKSSFRRVVDKKIKNSLSLYLYRYKKEVKIQPSDKKYLKNI
jgi:hypothetical protein